jgi:hydrogenase maturation protease
MAGTLVLGLGDALRSDDGAGVHAAFRLRESAGDARQMRILDAATLGFPLLPAFDGADGLIVLEAACSGAEPGTLVVHEGVACDRFASRPGLGPRELRLAQLLDSARLARLLPAQRALISIEPGSVDWGLALTPAVARALAACVARVLELVDRWGTPPGSTERHVA